MVLWLLQTKDLTINVNLLIDNEGLPEMNCFLQVSTDGLRVNVKFLDILQEKRKNAEMKELISIGTCGLHTIHHGFQNGKNTLRWSLKKVLSAMFKISLESHLRRSDYVKISVAESNDCPL